MGREERAAARLAAGEPPRAAAWPRGGAPHPDVTPCAPRPLRGGRRNFSAGPGAGAPAPQRLPGLRGGEASRRLRVM